MARREHTQLLYWSFADDLSLGSIVLYALCVFFAYSLTRMTRGAPAAWYVIVLALVLLLLRRVIGLYVDVQTQVTASETEETLLSFFVSLFFALGLFMLSRSFRRQLRLAQETQTQP